jgi:hypothetical protein
MGQQQQQRLRRARIGASVAATVISLACGTNVGILFKLPLEFFNRAGS